MTFYFKCDVCQAVVGVTIRKEFKDQVAAWCHNKHPKPVVMKDHQLEKENENVSS